MVHLSLKMMAYHSVMTSSLRIKVLKIDKFGAFSCDTDYNSRNDVFRDVISYTINHWRPKGASGEYKVSASRARKQAKRLLYRKCVKKIFTGVKISR